MTTIENPQSWLKGLTAAHSFTVLVYFRGSWCPFCQAYLREMNGAFREAIAAKGGQLVAVTAQSSAGTDEVRTAGQLAYEVVSDPSNQLARHFDVAITPKAQTPLAEHPSEYPHGMAQPAVIALDPSGEVLFRWAIDPNEMNLGGASDRPLPLDILQVIEAKLAGQDQSLGGDRRLDPAFLAERYPEQHATFEAWVAASSK